MTYQEAANLKPGDLIRLGSQTYTVQSVVKSPSLGFVVGFRSPRGGRPSLQSYKVLDLVPQEVPA